jgi:PKD repeat protein
VWMDKVISRLNGALSMAAAAAGFHYVDNESAFNGHDICNNNTSDSNRPWAHMLVLFNNQDAPSPFSFHPNSYGQQAMENDLYQAITTGPRPIVEQGQTSIVPVLVRGGQELLNIITQWAGSDTDTTLVSPSGQIYSASSPGISHYKTQRLESFVIPNPEPGTWQVRVYGTHVDQGGETVRVASSTTPAGRLSPVAVVSAAPSVGLRRTRVRFSAAASLGPFSAIRSYRWRFGDGGISSKAVVSHVYRRAGTYIATLTVTDTAGNTDTARQAIRIYRTDQPPMARLLVRQDRRHGALLYFDIRGSIDPDGQRVTARLSFGDGSSTTKGFGIHRYRFNGVYTVKLAVTDSRGLRRTRVMRIVVTHARRRAQRASTLLSPIAAGRLIPIRYLSLR